MAEPETRTPTQEATGNDLAQRENAGGTGGRLEGYSPEVLDAVLDG